MGLFGMIINKRAGSLKLEDGRRGKGKGEGRTFHPEKIGMETSG
jgi:hypothetical protein